MTVYRLFARAQPGRFAITLVHGFHEQEHYPCFAEQHFALTAGAEGADLAFVPHEAQLAVDAGQAREQRRIGRALQAHSELHPLKRERCTQPRQPGAERAALQP